MEDTMYKKRGGRKGKKRNKNKNNEKQGDKPRIRKRDKKKAVTHIDTLHDYDEESDDNKKMTVEHTQPQEPEEAKEGGKFLSEDKRKQLFGKDTWVNKKDLKDKKDFKDKKQQNKGKFNPPNRRRKAAPVNAVGVGVKQRKTSDASHTSYDKPVHKSFTPEGEDYDYEELAKYEPRLREVMVENKNPSEDNPHKYTLNWQNKLARYYLNKAILHYDYKLEYFDLPEDEGLVPTVPSRREYIHWIHDLFEEFEPKDNPNKALKGLDIGVGASVIYPIIGVKEYNWHFTGSDVCEESLKIAQEIVDKNKLSDQITLKFQPKTKNIFEGILDKQEPSLQFDFSMCNPPFFSSVVERNERRSVKNVHSRKDEDATEGGEIGFLCRMVKESVLYKNNIKWFTTFIGKKMDFVFL